jgi:hypothetical protein
LVDYGNCVAIPNDSHFFPQGMEYRDGLLPEAFDEVRKEIAQRCVFPKVMSVGRAIHAEMLKKPEPGFIAFFNYTATNISPRFSRGYLSAAFVVGYGEEFDMYPNSVACIPFNFLRTRDRAGQPLRDPNSSVVDDVRGFLGASIKSRGTQERVFLQPERAFILPTSFLYFPANFGPISRPKNPVYQEILGRRKGLNYDETELDHYLEFLGPLRSEFTPRVIEGGASDLKK